MVSDGMSVPTLMNGGCSSSDFALVWEVDRRRRWRNSRALGDGLFTAAEPRQGFLLR